MDKKHQVLELSTTQIPQHSPTVINFYASWHAPCSQSNLVFEELSRRFPSLVYIQCQAEEYPELSESFEISSVPTFVFLVDGKQVDRVEGVNAPLLTQKVEKWAQSAKTVSKVPLKTTSKPMDLNQRLKSLVESQPMMIFIKGTPSSPKCGFSRQAVELLAQVGAMYGSFDILEDEEVRQGLKEYSNWPTFPQIYINGELIGGLDILKEMIESGEFQNVMPKEEDLNTRLGKLIKRAPVMGSPSQPKCGFSRQIVALLQEQGITMDTFDILEDDEVRQGLKEFSNWPTFPQLYIQGELVGGLDIVREMIESGDLKGML